ncbi:Protein of unknown function [Parapedobacter composti]|uniref:Uncharacterized protein n=1 Tax=Parapedobacter composti TaxID=623281 RepID=A0A1I1F1F3_9SPHI|nr:DUF3109 family protein [Parapedobacter composti]SFB92752.1 Protein of unknown function [Parapedobacter composti]
MIEVGNVLVSEELIREEFVCNLGKCQGACCVEGDAGAPLQRDELAILASVYPQVKPYMTKKGIATVEASGTHVTDADGDLTTPCVDGHKECAYVTWENGITKCAIEKAYEAGAINWKKPLSCHLYPIRTTAYPAFDVLHYDRWHICHSACSLGRELKVPVYTFLKEPLIRKYGAEWYADLEESVRML